MFWNALRKHLGNILCKIWWAFSPVCNAYFPIQAITEVDDYAYFYVAIRYYYSDVFLHVFPQLYLVSKYKDIKSLLDYSCCIAMYFSNIFCFAFMNRKIIQSVLINARCRKIYLDFIHDGTVFKRLEVLQCSVQCLHVHLCQSNRLWLEISGCLVECWEELSCGSSQENHRTQWIFISRSWKCVFFAVYWRFEHAHNILYSSFSFSSILAVLEEVVWAMLSSWVVLSQVELKLV